MYEFEFNVYSNRWGTRSSYKVQKTQNGWYLRHLAISGDCDPEGLPFFKTNFKQDSISYPYGFFSQLGWLWEQVDSKEIDYEEAQTKLQELADWVSACEKSQPIWEGWN
jgi:hypothetical protein